MAQPLTGNAQFNVSASYCWENGKDVTRFKLVSYPTGGANFPVESDAAFETREQAEAAALLVNAGFKVAGLKFASYADD